MVIVGERERPLYSTRHVGEKLDLSNVWIALSSGGEGCTRRAFPKPAVDHSSGSGKVPAPRLGIQAQESETANLHPLEDAPRAPVLSFDIIQVIIDRCKYSLDGDEIGRHLAETETYANLSGALNLSGPFDPRDPSPNASRLRVECYE